MVQSGDATRKTQSAVGYNKINKLRPEHTVVLLVPETVPLFHPQ
jgi:hypothetical protein